MVRQSFYISSTGAAGLKALKHTLDAESLIDRALLSPFVVARQHVHHGSSAQHDGDGRQSRQTRLPGRGVSEQRVVRLVARRSQSVADRSHDRLRRRESRRGVGRGRRRRLVHVPSQQRARTHARGPSLPQCHL